MEKSSKEIIMEEMTKAFNKKYLKKSKDLTFDLEYNETEDGQPYIAVKLKKKEK